MAKKAKIDEIQYLRGFAFLAVVFQHAIGHYAYLPEAGIEDGVILGLLLIAAKFAVPMFIFITGLVLFYNYPTGVSYGSFILKRAKDIVLPYAVWSLVYAILFGGVHSIDWLQVKQVLTYWATGKASYHLWYVVMVIQLYLMFPFVQKAVQWVYRTLNNAVWPLRTLFGLLCIAYVLLTDQVGVIGQIAQKLYVPVLTPLFTEYADRNALYFFIYFLLGAAVGLNFQDWKQRLWNWRMGWISFYGVLSCVLLYKIVAGFGLREATAGAGHGKALIHYNATLLVQPFMAIFLLVSVLAMCVIAISFHQNAGHRLQKLITFVGQYSYGAYLAHALMLTVSTFVADALLPGWNVSLRTVAAFVLCAVLSLVTAAALGKFSLGRLLIGAPAPRRPSAQNQ